MAVNNQLQNVVLKQTNNMLATMLERESGALPKNFNPLRFKQNALAVLNDLDITKMKGQEFNLARCLMKGAYLGLDFFNKECYVITYGGQPQFMTDYKGEEKLCKKYSINPIKDIYAKLVREGDFFEEVIDGGKQYINFKPVPFNTGNIIGAFAVVYYKDGSMAYETMSKAEIEYIRDNFSKSKNGSAWTKNFGEMAKKTVLRRLCKHIELDFDNIEQGKAWEESSGMEFKNEPVESEKSEIEKELEDAGTIEDDDKEDIVEAEFEEVEENDRDF
mgnify:FL=1